jgi:hypothetical protein
MDLETDQTRSTTRYHMAPLCAWIRSALASISEIRCDQR